MCDRMKFFWVWVTCTIVLAILVGGWITQGWRFNAPLTSNGFPIAAYPQWPVLGVPAPTYVWSGNDPTGSLGYTNATYALTGSTETINTPFCPDGGYDDLTDGCQLG